MVRAGREFAAVGAAGVQFPDIAVFRPQDHAAASDFGTREECPSPLSKTDSRVEHSGISRASTVLAATSQAAKWTLASIAEAHTRMVSRPVPGVIDRQQQSGLPVRKTIDTKSLFRTITKNHIASSASRGIDSVLNGGT